MRVGPESAIGEIQVARAQDRSTGGLAVHSGKAFWKRVTSGWFGAGEKVEINQVGKSGERQRYRREGSVPSCSSPLREKGGGRWMSRKSKEGQGRMKITAMPTPWPGRVWMAGAGREQVPSCGWETFPVS